MKLETPQRGGTGKNLEQNVLRGICEWDFSLPLLPKWSG